MTLHIALTRGWPPKCQVQESFSATKKPTIPFCHLTNPDGWTKCVVAYLKNIFLPWWLAHAVQCVRSSDPGRFRSVAARAGLCKKKAQRLVSFTSHGNPVSALPRLRRATSPGWTLTGPAGQPPLRGRTSFCANADTIKWNENGPDLVFFEMGECCAIVLDS